MDNGYWRSAAADEAMQDEHGFIWRAMLGTIDIDLTGLKVLDAGCNQGGFLRLLVDRAGIAEGRGYDPAPAAVDDARRLAGGRPLRFETASTVPSGWGGFDAAFSHEVLYLIPDLVAHATAMFSAVQPGAPYFAAMGVHAGSRLMSDWHAASATELHLPPLHDLDDVALVFEGVGFEVALSRLHLTFIPVWTLRSGADDRRDLLEWLDYYSRDKMLFRFTHPTTA